MEHTIYLVSAIAGCTIVLLQVVLQVLGLDSEADGADGADGDFDPDGHGNAFFGYLSFKALCAFLGVFGLVGLIQLKGSNSFSLRVGIAFASGMAGVVLVGWMMRSLAGLQSSGNVNPNNAVGQTATVYLRIPENGGMGKVTVEIQGRSMEFDARSDGTAIDTGARVTVVSVDSFAETKNTS